MKTSEDDGKTWNKKISVYNRKSGYSDMVKLNNGNLLCLFETGKVFAYRGILIKFISRELIN